ncbi:hypothetical protein ACS5PN_17395 [Roseateles sp. NT4]
MQKILTPRFDLRSLGLTDAQLKAVAGARPSEKTMTATTRALTPCCWA